MSTIEAIAVMTTRAENIVRTIVNAMIDRLKCELAEILASEASVSSSSKISAPCSWSLSDKKGVFSESSAIFGYKNEQNVSSEDCFVCQKNCFTSVKKDRI